MLLSLFCSVLILSEAVASSSECDILFNAAIGIRDNYFRNPVVVTLWGEKSLQNKKNATKKFFAISSLDDDVQIRNKACAAAELGVVFGQSATDAGEYLEHSNRTYYGYTMRMIPKYKQEMKKIHRWMKKSGYPDNWPVNTDVQETRRMLESTPSFGTFVLLYFDSKQDYHKVATKLLASTSLEDYIEAMDVAPSIAEHALKWANLLKIKQKMHKIFAVMDSYHDYFEAILVHSDLLNLV